MKTRVHWLQEALAQAPTDLARLHIQHCIRRIKANRLRAKYPIFYNLTPLVDWALSGEDPGALSTATLPDDVLLQLRLTTMMPSADAVSVAWALWHQDNQY